MRNCLLLLILCYSVGAFSQEDVGNDSLDSIVTNTFWDNWYCQAGLDMNLLFPEGHNLRYVFPNGKSFGINAAVGKWFSPEFGGRIRVTWNNGILKNDHNTWLAPYGVPGENHRKGGFMTFVGDIQLNLHNLLGVYQQDRKWNLIASPRVGGWLDIGMGKGCPILSVGVVNTYRLSDRWRFFSDLSYNFVASINGVASGTGHGSNGFADISVGIETDLSKENHFYRVSEKLYHNDNTVIVNSFWGTWFAQAGMDMSLQNPCGTNFNNVFPNGNTVGLNLALGKWFTPEAGVRAGLNWQNGITVNHHATYLQPGENSKGNPDNHSFVSLYADMFFNIHNVIAGYDEQDKWNTIIYPRMGLARNFASEYKECPLLGVGAEQTYKINDKLKLFVDVAYQVTTSGFLDGKYPDEGLSCDGWFDVNVGMQYELGNNKWKNTR